MRILTVIALFAATALLGCTSGDNQQGGAAAAVATADALPDDALPNDAMPDDAMPDDTAPEAVIDWPEAAAEDVTTLDAIMKAYYDVVSGPAGEYRDWDRDKSLHVPGAQVVITRSGDNGETVIDRMSISDYHNDSPGPAASAFYEYELTRSVRQHGSTVHIWSTYEWRSEPDGEIGGQGVNSIELVWNGERYWITSWSFDGRTDAPAVPMEYMPADS